MRRRRMKFQPSVKPTIGIAWKARRAVKDIGFRKSRRRVEATGWKYGKNSGGL